MTEAGYRCAVPACRSILAIDMHHIWEVNAGGGDAPSNLLPLCPTCHALYQRGTIKAESIHTWKGVLVSLGRAFDQDAIDALLYLDLPATKPLVLSGDIILKHGGLLVAGLVEVFGISYAKSHDSATASATRGYGKSLRLTDKGRALVEAWKCGDREAVKSALEQDSCDTALS